MRLLLLALLLTGCRVSTPTASAPDPDDESWAFQHASVDSIVTRAPSVPYPADGVITDSLARGPWGASFSADSFQALVAAVDTSVSGTAEIIGDVGIYHDGEVTARDGERWQGLYPADGGVEARAFRLAVRAARDPVLDDDGDAPTGTHVSTPYSTESYDDWPQDDALALVRRPGAPFPSRPTTALAGSWPITSGRLALALGTRLYALEVVEGPERRWMPQGERVRTDRVLLLSDSEGAIRQPISAMVGGDAGSPEVRWAGDLDGDGKLDLVIDETNHYNLSAPALFLSSEARPGELVRRVARMWSVGC